MLLLQICIKVIARVSWTKFWTSVSKGNLAFIFVLENISNLKSRHYDDQCHLDIEIQKLSLKNSATLEKKETYIGKRKHVCVFILTWLEGYTTSTTNLRVNSQTTSAHMHFIHATQKNWLWSCFVFCVSYFPLRTLVLRFEKTHFLLTDSIYFLIICETPYCVKLIRAQRANVCSNDNTRAIKESYVQL